MWEVRDLPWDKGRIYPTLTSFLALAFLPLLQLLECLSGYMCGNNLTMKFPPEFLPLIYHCCTKWTDLRLQTSLICKKEKTTSFEKWLLGFVLQKIFPKKFLRIHREIPVRQSLSNTVKSFHAVRPLHWCLRRSHL